MTRIMAAVLLAVLGAGCSVKPVTTSPPRYYLLEAPATARVAVDERRTPELRVAIGPVTVSDYLDQPLIVTRRDDSEIALHEYRRWAAPLARSVPRVVRDALAARLPGVHSVSFPGTAPQAWDVRIAIEIARLDGRPGGRVTLDAQWQAVDADGAVLGSERVTLDADTAGEVFSAYVQAQAGLVAALGERIADWLARRAVSAREGR